MILFEDPKKLPDVGYIFCQMNGSIPALVLDADGPLWASNCMMMRETKLVFRYAVEPGSSNSGFLVYEPPHVESPLLAGDIFEGSDMFVKMLEQSGGNWVLVLQFLLEGAKRSRLFSVVNEQMKIIPSETGHEVWEEWIIDDPASAR